MKPTGKYKKVTKFHSYHQVSSLRKNLRTATNVLLLGALVYVAIRAFHAIWSMIIISMFLPSIISLSFLDITFSLEKQHKPIIFLAILLACGIGILSLFLAWKTLKKLSEVI